MMNKLDFSQLTAEAHARLRLRRRLNVAFAIAFAVLIVPIFFMSPQNEPSTILITISAFLPIAFVALYLFLMRTSIGWGVMLYIFRPSVRTLLRAFPPARINWNPLLLIAAMLISLIGLMFGVAFNAVVMTAIVMGCAFVQIQAVSALQRGDYAKVERYAAFAERWLPYPNLFGYRLVALINARRLDEALAMATEHLAHTPRLAPCLSETLHAQAMALIGAKRYDEAAAPAEKALQLSPDTASIYMTLAEYYITHAKNTALALETLNAAEPFLGAFAYNWRLSRAHTYAELGRFDEANAELATAEKMSVTQYPQHSIKASLLFATVDLKAREG